jgi:hypothetical protein
MIKKTITYNDLDGNPVTEDFYFGLSKAELAEMALSEGGGFEDRLRALVKGGDPGKIIKEFKAIIAMSVGKRSPDGKRFEKTEQISAEFMQTDAYSELFMQLTTDAAFAAEFTTGILPTGLAEQAQVEQKKIELPKVDTSPNFQAMTPEEFSAWQKRSFEIG